MTLSDPILITGAARSGTSLTAAIIHSAGAQSGVVKIEANEWNPTGYYENREIVDKVIKRLLIDFGYDPMGQERLPGEDLPRVNIRDQIFQIAEEQGIRPGKPWYFKGAKILLLYGSFIKSFPESRIVLVRRRANDIVASCMRTNFMAKRSTPEQWLDWLEDHEKIMSRLKDEFHNVMEVWYEDFILGNLEPMKRVVRWLDLHFDDNFVKSIIIKRQI
jgi:hypothetical protein